ncbi:MAG: DUF721 domain-containing protein [Cyanobacteria bacterium CRU_2_1]|nr:DUF721 domain-containing protein [Cyanobacteria bacterium RU_5_0]NJR60951.1 DUF721 domain-containing protein [Cyanobacteria bacterium CRU_2_1]
MSLHPLNHLLGRLENQNTWKERQRFQQLLSSWAEIVGTAVAVQTRPIYVQRRVLHVATSNPVWAQNLAFERQRILEKLNARLTLELTDIRFSTAQWRSSSSEDANISESDILWQNHPSQLTHPREEVSVRSKQPSNAPPSNPQTAFQIWAKTVQARSQHLPPCPVCQCPTPPGELQRWSICAPCAARGMRG